MLECIYSAEWYYNEQSVGSAISRFLASPGCPIGRSDIFYCSKLQSNNGYQAAKRSIAESVKKCGLGYIDLYLIHSPYGGRSNRLDSWRAIQEAKDQGLIKSIGVSNYAERHIQELLDSNPKYPPTVNQCDLHPFMARLQLVDYCRANNIALECWGPLVRAERFDHPTIKELASKHSATPAQVLMYVHCRSVSLGALLTTSDTSSLHAVASRSNEATSLYVCVCATIRQLGPYCLHSTFAQQIPKSVSQHRIIENANVFAFELDQADMDRLLSLDEYLVTE